MGLSSQEALNVTLYHPNHSHERLNSIDLSKLGFNHCERRCSHIVQAYSAAFGRYWEMFQGLYSKQTDWYDR